MNLNNYQIAIKRHQK